MDWLKRQARRYLSREQRRFIKFCVVGASGVPVNLLGTWLAYRSLAHVLVGRQAVAAASLLGIALSIFSNFLLNDLWTWGDRRAQGRGFAARLLRFYLVSALAATLQFGMAMSLGVLLALHYLLAQLAGIGLAMVLNYAANHCWTFRARRQPPGVAVGVEHALPVASTAVAYKE